MKKVMICTVGGSEQPVINAIKQDGPLDLVYFICSAGDKKNGSVWTIENQVNNPMKAICVHCKKNYTNDRITGPIAEKTGLTKDKYKIISLEDPDDLSMVTGACKKIEEELLSEEQEENLEVIANYTGGTKTMSLGLGYFAIRTHKWILKVNSNTFGRKNLIAVDTGDVSTPQNMTDIIVYETLARAEQLTEKKNYSAAKKLVTGLLNKYYTTKNQKNRLYKLRSLAAMFDAWDKFDYSAALCIAESNINLKKEAKLLKKLIKIKSLMQSAHWGKTNLDGKELVKDIIKNAKNCAERSRFDDATGRLYRATELLAQLRLLSRYNLNSGDIDPQSDAIPDDYREKLPKNEHSDKIKTGLFGSYALLATIKDPLGQYFEETRKELRAIIDIRNSSFFAHGLRCITEREWEKTGIKWIKWLEEGLKK